MKEIQSGVYTEDTYPGVLLGAVIMPRGTMLIDAPPRPDDGRSWHATVRSMGRTSNRMVVLLDSHPDRALGSRALESPVMAQEETVRIFEERSTVFKAPSGETGSEWEQQSGLSGIRWVRPNLTFTERAEITWGEHQVIVEHHPGVEPGATWVIIPELKILFAGDTVVRNQPPFLTRADIPVWKNTLDELLTKPYKEYLILSSRGGKMTGKEIRDQRRFLSDVLRRLKRVAKRDGPPEDTAVLAPRLIDKWGFPAKREKMYLQRLQHGLYQYYVNHYYSGATSDNE